MPSCDALGTATRIDAPAFWPRESFATVCGWRVHYCARGAGPPLILIHGLLGYSFSWRRNLECLGRHFRVYALDLPGLGYSDRPPDYTYSFAAAADLIAGFARVVGEPQVRLAGHSFGGAVALLCASRHPQLVARLSLLAPPNPFSRRGMLRIKLGGIPRVGDALFYAARWQAPLLAKFLLRYRMYGDPGAVDEETIEGYVRPLLAPGSVRALRRMLAAWDMAGLRSALAVVRQPALLIWGGHDCIVPLASGHRLAGALRARLEVLPQCGHLVNEEAPDEVNRLLVSFNA